MATHGRPGRAVERTGSAGQRLRRSVRRGGRRALAQWPFLLVFALLLGAVVFLTLSPQHWRRGSAVIAVGMLVAGALRLVLHSPRAGMLAVRSRWLDVACYWCVGVAILTLVAQLQ